MDQALQQPVLVLNRFWQAVNTCSARRAFSLLYLGHAHVVHGDGESFDTFDFQRWQLFSQNDHSSCEHDWVHTVTSRIMVPRVILLLIFDHLPMKEVKLTRENVFERDGYTCQYCHRKFERPLLNIDHVVPRHRGGQTTWENVVTSCIQCNTRKGNRLPHEAGMKLLRNPRQPKQRPFVSTPHAHHRHPLWAHFLDVGRWKVELCA